MPKVPPPTKVNPSVEPPVGQPVDPEAVISAVERDQLSGELCKKIEAGGVRYQVSVSHPGYLEQIDRAGHCCVGSFSDGIFTPLNEKD